MLSVTYPDTGVNSIPCDCNVPLFMLLMLLLLIIMLV
jgi:hypothetical protein